MRREARLASKRKWKNDHSEQEKEKYQSQKEKYKKYHQDRYINTKKRNESKEGETFEQLFMAAYSKAKRILWDKLYDEAFDNNNPALWRIGEASVDKGIYMAVTDAPGT